MSVATAPAPPIVESRPSRVLTGLTLAFILTAQWSGVLVGPVQVSDVILALCLTVLILGPRTASPLQPTGVYVLLGCVAAATVLAQLAPPDPTWSTMRFTGFTGIATHTGLGNAGLGAWAFALKLALATWGAWAVLARLHHDRPDTGRLLFLTCWLAGAVLSAVVAVLEWKAGLDLSAYLAQPIDSPRAAGLAFHPNTLALYCASSIPVTAYFLRRRRTFLVGVLALVALWGGLLAADSRAGIAVAVLATLTLPFLTAGGGRAAILCLVFGLFSSPWLVQAVTWIQGNTRLATGAGQESDAGRRLVIDQSILDWQHSPFFGIGGTPGGVSAPLAVLAAGGLIMAGGFVALLAWTVARARPALHDPDVRVALVAAAAVLGVICWQNNLVDRGQYLFLFAGVLWAATAGSRPDPTPTRRTPPPSGRAPHPPTRRPQPR